MIELLRSVDTTLEGAEAVVVGRSHLFGKPMAQLLLAERDRDHVSLTRARDLREVCARADVLIAAVGRPRLIEGGFVEPGAVVIDVGMNRLTPEELHRQAGLVGDVDFAAAVQVASAITPVPGGVGPMTIAFLYATAPARGTRSGGHPMSLRRLRLGELIALAAPSA